jgi:phytoene synthase
VESNRSGDPTRAASPAADEAATREALRACVALTRRHSSTFHLGSRLFRADKRYAVSAVYAACRTGDDAVDEARGPADAAARLDAWWAGIERTYAGRPGPAAAELGLRWVLDRHDVPKSAFEELRLGFESDLGMCRVETTDELLIYCRRVAGVVGLMIAPIAGYDGGEATLRAAVALGEAMQLTNVLRDVGEDLGRDRCYLPADRMAAHGVDVAELRGGTVSPGYVRLLEEIAGLANERYRQGWTGIPRLHGAAGTAVGVAALNYEGILRKLRQNRYDNLTRRAHLRPLERIALIPRAALSVWSGAS